MRIEDNLINEIYGDDQYEKNKKASVTNLRKRFRIEIHLKEQKDPYIDSIVFAQTNDEKVELLKGIRELKTKSEFDEFVELLLEHKAISDAVFSRL